MTIYQVAADPSANNYNTTATVDDGSCSFGSDDEDFVFRSFSFHFEEGDCDYPSIPIAGCTRSDSYRLLLQSCCTIDNGTCPNIDEPPIDPVTKSIKLSDEYLMTLLVKLKHARYCDYGLVFLCDVVAHRWQNSFLFFSTSSLEFNSNTSVLEENVVHGAVYSSYHKTATRPRMHALLVKINKKYKIYNRYRRTMVLGNDWKIFYWCEEKWLYFPFEKLTGREKMNFMTIYILEEK